MSTAPVSKIDSDSVDTAFSAFDLFAVPPTNTSVRRGEYEIINPTGGLSREGEIQFDIFSNNGVYTDLENSYLELDVRVVKKDGTNLPANAGDVKVYPGDSLAHSLFNKVTV